MDKLVDVIQMIMDGRKIVLQILRMRLTELTELILY
jgi:hypothetical protein